MKNLLNSISKIPVIALSAITLSTGAFADPIKVIFETDMEGDCDDAGALAMLHYYADQGDIELLAVITNSSADASVGVVDAINTYFDRPDTSDVKLGAYKGSSVGRTDAMMYEALDDNTSTYPHNVRSRNHADVQDPVSLYKELLTAHDDVVIISVGHLQNVSALIDDPEGYQLVEDKVKRLVVGGGSINYLQRPYNLTRWGSSETSLNVLNDFPAPMLFSTFYVGGPINTGQVLANNTSLNPVREAYRTFPTSANRQYFPNGSSTNGSAGPVLEVGRPSWDLLCVMIGTEKYPEYFNVNSYGYMSLDNSSTDENQHSTQWLSNTLNSNHENHSYVTLTRPLEEYEAIISQAMDYELIVGENLLQNGSFEADDIGYGEWDPVTSLTGWAA
ncbi:nucleoside hydrolase, partial [Hirschia maritima]|uniref:nucleoside hydrolase n=1 Tax=Hirschia maritima TaxID=1121961 RepID=UPI00036574CD